MATPIEDSQITKMLAKYGNPAATKKDVIEALRNYRSLAFNLQNFVFNNGSSKELFNLQGTIPVVYKNNTYHIPICIWLMDTHPHNAPICFVMPTANMEIKISMFVDRSGRIYLPYLHDWHSVSSDLLGLIQVMIVTFSEYPPVYSVQKQNTAPYPATPYMPQTGGNAVAGYPPYPTAGNAYGSFAANPRYPNPPAAASANSGFSNFGGIYPGYNPPAISSSTGTITEEHIKASLISAVEDKLRRRIHEKLNQYQAEIDTLNRTKQELVEGSSKIENVIVRLQREELDLQNNIKILSEKEEELEKTIEMLDTSEGIDPDEAVTTTAPLYRQLLNSYAEEAATEDAIYYLGEALRSGVIDLETFLKHVRQLSRKQFRLRVIMQKCRQKAGLAG